MQDPYRISLKSNATTWYALTGAYPAPVVTQTTAYYLPTPPSKWDEVEVKDARNLRYSGLERSYSAGYKFVLEGAKILRHIWFTLGRKAKCIMVVEKLDTTTQQYSVLFTSDLNFRTAQNEDTYFGIEILQDGIQALLKSREGVEYEFWMASAGQVTVELPVFKLKGSAQLMTLWPIPIQGNNVNSFQVGNGFTPFYTYIDKTTIRDRNGAEPISFGNDISNVSSGTATANIGIIGQLPFDVVGNNLQYDQKFIFRADKNLTNVRLKGNLSIFFFNSGTGSGVDTFHLMVSKVGSGPTITTISDQFISLAVGASVTTNFSLTMGPFTMAAGEILKIWVKKIPTSSFSPLYNVQWGHREPIDITFEHDSEVITFKARRYQNVYQSLISKITDGTATGTSALLSTIIPYNSNYDLRPTNLVIASTNSICGITKPDPNNSNLASSTYSLSLADLFQDIESMQSAGLGVSGSTVKLEKKEAFFSTAQTAITIDNPIDVRIMPATEFLYNTMKIGAPNQNYDGLNGLEEFNTTQQWQFCKTFPLTDNIKELDLTTKFRRDVFGVYYTWINNVLLNKDNYNSSSNSGSTNDIFVLQIADNPNVGTGNYNIKTWSGTGITITGVSDPNNTGNLGLSPKRCMLRHGRYLRSILHGLDSDMIKYVRQEKNGEVSSSLGSGTVNEDADQGIGVLATIGANLFIPYVAEVECVSPANYLALIAANPNGVIKVTWKGVTLEGFPLETGLKPSYPDATYSFKLLLSPNNNLSNLIY